MYEMSFKGRVDVCLASLRRLARTKMRMSKKDESGRCPDQARPKGGRKESCPDWDDAGDVLLLKNARRRFHCLKRRIPTCRAKNKKRRNGDVSF